MHIDNIIARYKLIVSLLQFQVKQFTTCALLMASYIFRFRQQNVIDMYSFAYFIVGRLCMGKICQSIQTCISVKRESM